MVDLAGEYLDLRREAGAVWLRRDFVRVAGPESLAFLQGQLSQDVRLAVGGSAWALLLQPQGKVVALVRVARTAEDEFVLDTDAGWGETVLERLRRFKLRVRCDLEPLAWRCLAVRGPKAHDVVAPGAGLAVVGDWPGLPGVDLVGDDPEVPDGVPVCSLDAYEAVRIEAGVPVMGRELDERTIPAEAGVVEQSVSFTKGCYTGQELVARIDARGGNVARRLRGVVVAANVLPPPGAEIRVGDAATAGSGGKVVGQLTSVAESLERRAPVALAYVRREVVPPAEVTVAWAGDHPGSVPARVEALPLVG